MAIIWDQKPEPVAVLHSGNTTWDDEPNADPEKLLVMVEKEIERVLDSPMAQEKSPCQESGKGFGK